MAGSVGGFRDPRLDAQAAASPSDIAKLLSFIFFMAAAIAAIMAIDIYLRWAVHTSS
jgi:hypothetical protein